LTGVKAIAGGRDSTLALRSDGTVWGWGADNYGQLGDNGGTTSKLSPVQMVAPGGSAPLTGITAISSGGSYSVMLTAAGTVLAVGDGTAGEFGVASSGSAYVPVTVPGLANVTAISAGYAHVLALDRSGAVWSWGDNANGQLGNGSSGGTRAAPAKVGGLGQASSINAGGWSSFAVS
jgi:alpha-tubulin suppressor-like RCC1 family protein